MASDDDAAYVAQTDQHRRVWDAWNALPDGCADPVATIAAQTGDAPDVVRSIVYPDDARGARQASHPTPAQYARAAVVPDWESDAVGPHGEAILRVGVLREMLEDLDDSVPVVLAADGWYVNVAGVESPATDDDYSCLTLFPGSDWDSRSL